MKSIMLVTLLTLGGLTLFTSCPQPIVDPICAISDGLGLSSDKTAVTTDGTAITLTVSVCANIPAAQVEFFDAAKSWYVVQTDKDHTARSAWKHV
jgi:hypothetical protein